MVGEVLVAGLSAFKTMFDIAKSMKDMSDTVARNAAVSDLWEQIFAAQSRYAALLERVSELEKEVASFETWETEKENYEPKEVAFGAFVYVLKESMRRPEQNAWFCANCYQHRKKSFLQAHHSDASFVYHKCPECAGQIRVPTPPATPPGLAIANRGYDPLR
jgi:hypothetical protein